MMLRESVNELEGYATVESNTRECVMIIMLGLKSTDNVRMKDGTQQIKISKKPCHK